jgi:hypothetical protein
MSASEGRPRYLSLGENDSELLITTMQGYVFRRCIDSTGCKPSIRDSTMMLDGGPYLLGIGVLDETYIVADWGDDKIYECPLTSVGINMNTCDVFAYKPQGADWDPVNLLVDPIKRLVFVLDFLNSEVFVFAFDRTFLGPLASSRGDLVMPMDMAQRPGLYALLSISIPPIFPTTAGELIESPLTMVDAYNFTVSDSHPTSAHDLALEVTATGVFPGTDIPAIIMGEVL